MGVFVIKYKNKPTHTHLIVQDGLPWLKHAPECVSHMVIDMHYGGWLLSGDYALIIRQPCLNSCLWIFIRTSIYAGSIHAGKIHKKGRFALN